MSADQLWDRMRVMFDRRDKRLSLRREFEKRTWNINETFAEYFHNKVITASQVPIDEDEMVDYLIEGIPNLTIRHQASTQRFEDKETMLKALENVSLRADLKHPQKSEKRLTVKEENNASVPSTKEEGGSNSKSTLKCFNCNQSGHIAVNCQQSKREKTCFKCLQIGHKAKDCSVSGTAVKENVQPKASVNSAFKENDEFLVKYGMNSVTKKNSAR